MFKIDIDINSYLELEKIGIGAFKPLEGFMTENDFYSVVNKMRLKNGVLFPLPVMLPIKEADIASIKYNEIIKLSYNNIEVGEILPVSIFRPDIYGSRKALFSTDDINHPGFKLLIESGTFFIGGPIKFYRKVENEYSIYEKSPKEVKNIIKLENMKSVAGFQTRNVPHKAHEYILLSALKEVDGLFVQPLIGKKKSGDFTPHIVMTSYNVLKKSFLPKKRVILGALTTSMRYAGPREAIFHALIRKNCGCTHFLIGRDHAGVGNYYGEYDAQKLCIEFEKELNIKIIRIRGPFYCSKCEKITTDKECQHIKNRIPVSGTNIRDALINKKTISENFMRKEIVESIKGKEIFIE